MTYQQFDKMPPELAMWVERQFFTEQSATAEKILTSDNLTEVRRLYNVAKDLDEFYCQKI